MQILFFGIALPVAFGLIFIVLQGIRNKLWKANYFSGLALASTLLLSAMSEDSFYSFTTQNLWLWFPLAVGLSALIASTGNAFTNSLRTGALIVCASAIPAALVLNIPNWQSPTSRFLLGVVTAIFAFFLNRVVERHNNFSTFIALSFSLTAASVLAMISGFAKLAVPIGAVSCCLGIVSLIRLITWTPAHNHVCLGLSGAVTITSVAVFGSATGLGYDTSGLPIICWVLSAIAPLGLWVGELPRICSRPTLSSWARIFGCAILSAVAIVIAVFVLNSPTLPIT